jgi:hypothetical protein
MTCASVLLRTSSKRVERRCAPFLTLLTLLAAVPRPGIFAHRHAGDVPGHVHVHPQSATQSTAHGHAHSAAHHDHGVVDHVHSEAAAGGPSLFAAGSAQAADHWHSQAPFQHASATYAHVVAPVARIEAIAAAPARLPPDIAPPSARSRGPPPFTPSRS